MTHLHDAEGKYFLKFCTPGTSMALPMPQFWASMFSLDFSQAKQG